MVLTILNQIRRFFWPFIVSVGLHASLIAGLLYATVSSVSMPTVEQPMAVMLMTPELQSAPPEVKATPDSIKETTAPVQVPKQMLKPKLKSKLKPKQHREIKSQSLQTETSPVTPASSKPLPHPSTALAIRAPANIGTNDISNAPRVTNRINPIYPSRAKALGIEGRVSVMFDVNAYGRVENVRILSAQPRNMFERDIRLAMRLWTYELYKPVTNLTVNFKFDLKRDNNS
ncbi:MAG: hypothetical protein HNEKOMLI_00540 [Sodalis sp. Psp]|nr:hypothetical protein [Sodalis sp. Psp]MCR3757011.1 hypothetical protein [Sodalis sp. Ppy]